MEANKVVAELAAARERFATTMTEEVDQLPPAA
jgi:hypothetical protein